MTCIGIEVIPLKIKSQLFVISLSSRELDSQTLYEKGDIQTARGANKGNVQVFLSTPTYPGNSRYVEKGNTIALIPVILKSFCEQFP